MSLVAQIAVGFVAIEHFLFLVLEMFFWTSPFGKKTFGLSDEFAQQSAGLAANQGLYNGFLSAGLIWSLLAEESATSLATFFLGCVIVAGIYGAFTAKRTILFVQAVPAAIALSLVLL